MSHFSYSKLRVFILIIFSLCISSNSIAMVTEMTMNQMPAMNSHCAEMMGDVHTSSPEFSSHHALDKNQDKNSCGNHYACFGLELLSVNLMMIEMPVELNAKQSVSTYTNRTTDGYFALPDPPPRYTL